MIRGQPYVACIAIVVLSMIVSGSITTTTQTSLPTSGVSVNNATLQIGVLLPRSGKSAEIGSSVEAALAVANDDLNAFLGTAGSNMQLRFVVRDTETSPNAALVALQDLNAQGIKLVVGPYLSTEVNATMSYANENNMTLVSYGSTAISFSVPKGNVFRFVPDVRQEPGAIASRVGEDGVSVVIPIWRDDLWGNELVAAMRSELETRGLTVAEGAPFSPATSNFSSTLAKIVPQITTAAEQYGASAVAVDVIAGSEAAQIFTQAADMPQLVPVRWYGNEAIYLNPISTSPEAAQFAVQTCFVTIKHAEGHGDRFDLVKARVTEKLGHSPEPVAYVAYDAAWVLTKTYLMAGSADAALMRTTLPVVASTYNGITGNMMLNDVGDRAYAKYDYWTIRHECDTFRWLKIGTYQSRSLESSCVI